jgi:hypothetical protein
VAPEAGESPGIPCTHPDLRFDDQKYDPVPLSDVERRRIAEADAFIRDHLADRAARGELVRQKHARATAFFEARHWTEAAMSYLDVALNYPDEELGLKAAVGYLESANVVGTQAVPPRVSCFSDMLRYVNIFLDLYCRGSVAPAGAASCVTFFRIQKDSQLSFGEKLIEGLPPDPDEVLHQYAQGSVDLFEQARRCFTFALRFGLSPRAERCDELAFDAGRASLAAGLRIRATNALTMLRDPKHGVENSEYARRLAQAIDRTPMSRSCCSALDCAPLDRDRSQLPRDEGK